MAYKKNTSQLPDSTNKRYVTDAQQTVIGNTTGTNSGDQTLAGLGGVPTTRQVNGHALSADVTVTKSDVGLGSVANSDTTTTANITDSSNKRFVTDAQQTVIGNTSGTNTGDQTLPVKASGSEIDTGTDDAKFTTAKALTDSHKVPTVTPSTTGKLLRSNGTDWTSAAVTTADIAASTDKNYVTDAQQTVIAATSGTNTGDQTNISGNAATVTTNANLTGVITSSGNATSIASKTGTGNKFVVDTSPAIVTPTIADLTNMTHNHQNAAGGATLDHHLALTNFAANDDHTQYALLAGRGTAQTFSFGTASGETGGTISSTAHATKGKYGLNAAATIVVDEANLRIGINSASPGSQLTIAGVTLANSAGATGSNAAPQISTTGGTGQNTTITSTGTGGNGSTLSFTTGNGGTANAALTSSQGGNGGSFALLTGTGAASAVAGASSNGGDGGAVTITSGPGGAATLSTANNGGNGGNVTIKAGIGGTGGTTAGTAGTIILQTGNGTAAATTKWTIAATTTTIADAHNIVVGSTTGTKIGTAIGQKLGLWNTAPIAQPTTAVTSATFVANAGTAMNTLSTFDGYTLPQIVKALRNFGALA